MARLFGTDGVRGIANTELSPELAFKLGYYGARVLAGGLDHRPQFVVGMDTRLSGTLLCQALCSGICSAGADVYVAGVIPTPGIAYLTQDLSFDAGVVISASHNPFEFNGIKFFNSDGFKLSDEMEDAIEDFVVGRIPDDSPRVTGEAVGTVHTYPQGVEHYLTHLRYAMGLDLTGMRIALDCANGAASDLAPRLFRQLGADLYVIGQTPDGKNINENCGSTCLEPLAELVLREQCDLGLALDGDADRLLAIDHQGQVVNGDCLLAILAEYLRTRSQLKENTLVVTVMSNLGLMLHAREAGIHLEHTKVGDRYVLEAMRQGGYSLGGEQSGHMILLDYSTTGDGILSALALLKALRRSGKSLAEASQMVKILPQVLLRAEVPNTHKVAVMESSELKQAIEAVEVRLGETGRVLVRASGTEPVIRVMLEGSDTESIQAMAEELIQVVNSIRDEYLQQC